MPTTLNGNIRTIYTLKFNRNGPYISGQSATRYMRRFRIYLHDNPVYYTIHTMAQMEGAMMSKGEPVPRLGAGIPLTAPNTCLLAAFSFFLSLPLSKPIHHRDRSLLFCLRITPCTIYNALYDTIGARVPDRLGCRPEWGECCAVRGHLGQLGEPPQRARAGGHRVPGPSGERTGGQGRGPGCLRSLPGFPKTGKVEIIPE